MPEGRYPADEVRDDFIPREDYLDPAFARLEAEKLWPNVWQMTCRLEEIPAIGDYYTYDILGDSIIVIRTGLDEIRAFHNTCPHRGTLLTEGRGNARQFVCRFHGWRFALDGRCVQMVDQHDWQGCLEKSEVKLSTVK